MNAADIPEALVCANATEWETWLAHQHRQVAEIWLVIARKGFESEGLVIGDALDMALCFGWIDSHRKGRDKRSYLQRYSPRRPRAPWSQLNVERANALINNGRMREAGLIEILAAQADGRWAAAYAPQADAATPTDLEAALNASAPSADAFDRLSKSARYALILPILKAVSPEARARRVQKALETLAALT
ncbi:MAG: YdeI/OmpD-associated family protein [Sphingomonas sp.]